jgi:hypothetical protein
MRGSRFNSPTPVSDKDLIKGGASEQASERERGKRRERDRERDHTRNGDEEEVTE